MTWLLPPWSWWPALSTWTSWITIVGVIVAVVAFCKPRFQHWVIRRAFHFFDNFVKEAVIRGDSPLNGWREKLRFKSQVWKLRVFGKLSPMELRLSFASLFDIVHKELKTNSVNGIYRPPPDTNPTIMEIAGYYQYKKRRKQEKEVLRQHRGIRCSGDCGTKYGKRHKKQGFLGDGVKNTGWQICEEACTPESKTEHYCGMCERKRERQRTLDTS